MINYIKYNYNRFTILFIGLISVIICYGFIWRHHAINPVNFLIGDARDYYSYLISAFVKHDLREHVGSFWFLLKTPTGIINAHPVGEALLIMPFYMLTSVYAFWFNYSLNGISTPFQVAISVAAIFYALVGLIYLQKLLKLNNFNNKTIGITLLLLYFGTNLINYSLSEPAMSHVYSFCLVSVFVYHSFQYINTKLSKYLYFSFLLLGLIVLIRLNNALVVFIPLVFFKNMKMVTNFFKSLLVNKHFYIAGFACVSIISIQNFIWLFQNGQFFNYPFKADGFYWLNPNIIKMLFGFDNGFFIYVPLCLFFLLGLFIMIKQQFFSGIVITLFLSGLIYFFASHWAYTYHDGLGIRVLVDYYSVFGLIGAKVIRFICLFKKVQIAAGSLILFLVSVNLIYCYQNNRGIILRASMNFAQWKYTFLKTTHKYLYCLGGNNDLVPYSDKQELPILRSQMMLNQPHIVSKKLYTELAVFNKIGLTSNRLFFKMKIGRKERAVSFANDAEINIFIKNKKDNIVTLFYKFKVNETPCFSIENIDREFNYNSNISGNFSSDDQIYIYLKNLKNQLYSISKFQVEVYNYNYN